MDWRRVQTAKVWIAMGLFSMALILGGKSIGNRYGLLIGFLLALSLNSIVFFYGDLRLDSLFRASEVEGRDPYGVLRQVRELARRIGLRTPRIMLVDSPTALVFSSGLLIQKSTIFLSEAFLEKLSEKERLAILVHELVKIKNQTVASGTAASALAGLVSYFASALDRVLTLRAFRKSKLHSAIIAGPMTLLVSPLVALLIRMSLSRSQTLDSDRETTEALGGESQDFARALMKLDSYLKARPLDLNLAEAHLFTVSPLSGTRFWSFVSAQPSTEERIRELTGHFPL